MRYIAKSMNRCAKVEQPVVAGFSYTRWLIDCELPLRYHLVWSSGYLMAPDYRYSTVETKIDSLRVTLIMRAVIIQSFRATKMYRL